MLSPQFPDTDILRPVNLPLLRSAYNDKDGVEGGRTTVLQETPTSFIIENLIPVRSDRDIAFVDNPAPRSSIQYELPKDIFFDVYHANQIPKLANFRIRCPELDEALGFVNGDADFYYLFGQNSKIGPDGNTQSRYLFNLCDPLDAVDILVIAAINQWHARPSIGDWFRKIQSLVNNVCEQHVGGRVDPYRGDFEFYGTTKFYLPYFTSNAGTDSPEYEMFQAETKQRIQNLRQACHNLWNNNLHRLKQKAINPESYIAALKAQADALEAQAHSLRQEVKQCEKQLQQKAAQPA